MAVAAPVRAALLDAYRRGLRAAARIRAADAPAGNRTAQHLRDAYAFYAPARWDATREALARRAGDCVLVLEKLAARPDALALFFRRPAAATTGGGHAGGAAAAAGPAGSAPQP